eukprot:CAMPEP_0182472984 /NCGR_PEP_ID=MMETSP1319-20130603/23158_1 /TAXON_ID=172717 /ORGANISM="Bolidomonas pacifica, Strain RCC208" /LENGTH=45 /DNA_ID= /DNA_START= /DNA_END= /DNA_ORIENTATION=
MALERLGIACRVVLFMSRAILQGTVMMKLQTRLINPSSKCLATLP